MKETKIVDFNLVLPKGIKRRLKWTFPFFRIPQLSEYNQEIIHFSKKNNQLPFYTKFDINNDGKEEIIVVQKSIIGGFGRLLIISSGDGKVKFEKIKWKRPVNSLYFDYLIDVAEPREYQTFGFKGLSKDSALYESMNSKKVTVNFPHLITRGYLTRIVFWDGLKYCQEKISSLNVPPPTDE